MKLGEVVRQAGKTAQHLKESGGAQTNTGLPGMLALMGDSIRRWFTADQDPKEVMNLAAQSLLCLQLTMEGVDKELLEAAREYETDEPESEEDEPEESYDVEDDVPTLGPVPFEYEGWQFDQGKAVQFEKWLRTTGKWDLLDVEQQSGILDAVNGNLENSDEVVA